jgi:YD repeat-containing protein
MTELGARLREIQLPDSEQAMRVAARVIALEVAAPKESRLKRWRRWIASLLAGALIAFAFTAPGRAITGELGRVVGIGDEPTEDLPLGAGSLQTVIGTGAAPNGTAYEVVASTEVISIGQDQGARETCVRLDLLRVKEVHELNCITGTLERALASRKLFVRGTLASEALGDQGLIVKGPAAPVVARVVIVRKQRSGRSTTYPASLYRLDGSLTEAIEGDDPLRYVVAFLPSSLVPARTSSTPTLPGPGQKPPGPGAPPITETPPDVRSALRKLTAVAYDAAGNRIARQSLDAPNAQLSLYPPVDPTRNVPQP